MYSNSLILIKTRHKCFNSTNNSAKSNQSAAGLAAAQVTRERGGFSRLSRFFHRPSSTAMNAFNHTNAGGNIVNGGIGGVQTTSLMRKHGGGGSAGAGLTTFRGGISSMKVCQKAFFNYLFDIYININNY